jgi:phosphopantothenoylcysteine decarboxylase/phosphopantothenate--cysteine ligase
MADEKLKFEDLKVLLCVSGGVAAYKAVDLASRLVSQGASVKTAMTEAAVRLVGAKSFEAITNSAVFTSLWDSVERFRIEHISLVEWADVVIVAPATANIMAKVANGICDDLVSTILCVCWSKQVLLAPAMNVDMWNNPAVQRNVKAVKEMGFEIVGPAKGRLACGTIAEGRMSEPAEILQAVKQLVSKIDKKKKTGSK